MILTCAVFAEMASAGSKFKLPNAVASNMVIIQILRLPCIIFVVYIDVRMARALYYTMHIFFKSHN